MKKLLLIILLLSPLAFFVSPRAYAQIDTEFWFTAPSLTTSHVPDNIWLVIVTYGDGADVSVTQPARGRTLMTERRLEANTTFTYSIKSDIDYRNTIETQADQTAHDNGIFVQSSVPVSVYYVATANNSEIYTLKGRHGLGTDFVVPMQNRRACNHTAPAYCSIEFVATEDNTTVTVQTTQPTNELAMAGTVTITLNKGQSYAIRARQGNTPGGNHLGGTRITSDKPIAVNSTDDSAATGNDKDLIGEQLVPSIWAGSHYIAVSNNSDNEYAYFFSTDSNPVQIYTSNGTTETMVGNVQPGQTVEYKLQKLSAQVFYTKDNSPFILFQVTANGGELSGTELPSLNCSGSDEVSYIPALNTVASNVTILTRTEFTSGFSVNGDTTRLRASLFLPVPAAPEWSYTPSSIIQLEGSEKTLRIRNHLGVFHLGVLDATQGAVSYGYFSNFGSVSMSCSSLNDYYYAGQDIQLNLVAADKFDSIWWEGPKGIFGHNDGSPVIHSATMADAGMYIVNGIHNEGCEVKPDTFFLTVLDTAAFYHCETVCHGDPVTVQSTGEAPLEWFRDYVPMPSQTSSTYTYTPTASSTFIIASTTPGIDIFSIGAPVDYTYSSEKDTAIMWADSYVHCIPGVEYVWTVSLGVDGTNPVPPRVLLSLNGIKSEQRALPNNSTGQILSVRFTPQDRYAVMRILAVNTKPNRHFRVESMSLKPVLPLTETIDIISLPAPIHDSVAVTDYCDTLPPYIWRTRQISQPGIYRDTVYYSSTGCDSAYYTLNFDTVHCCPIPVVMDSSVVVYCDTLLPYTWRLMQVDKPGIYRDTVRSRGCDSLYYILSFDTIHCFTVDSVRFMMDTLWTACDGDGSLQLSYHLLSGMPTLARAFVNGSLCTEQPVSPTVPSISVPLPAVPDYYTVTLVLEDTVNQLSDSHYAQLVLQYDPLKVFAHKWNNVLAIYSPAYSGYPSYNWSSYSWYRDDDDLGCSYSYYRIADGEFQVQDCYRVLLTRAEDGVSLFTCPYCIEPAVNSLPEAPAEATKLIRDGRLVISIDGAEYNAQGELIK